MFVYTDLFQIPSVREVQNSNTIHITQRTKYFSLKCKNCPTEQMIPGSGNNVI